MSGHDHAGGDHAGHAHSISPDADRGKLAIALGLIVAFMLIEVVVGALVHSLALLSDAAHMLTDAGALGLSLVAINLAKRPAKGALTYGFKRVEILSAQFNGATLLVLALLIIYEGISRLTSPPPVQGTAVLVVALVGILVNLVATYTLSKANRQSMNIEGSFQHLLTDLAAFIFTAMSGRSPPASRPCQRTSSSIRTPTATPPAAHSNTNCTSTSGSSTPRCRSTIKATSPSSPSMRSAGISRAARPDRGRARHWSRGVRVARPSSHTDVPAAAGRLRLRRRPRPVRRSSRRRLRTRARRRHRGD